jgi:hypothetical protein
MAACLLDPVVRGKIWDGIRSGRDRDSLVRMANTSPETLTPEQIAGEVDETSEGTDFDVDEESRVDSERGDHYEQRPPGPQVFGPEPYEK